MDAASASIIRSLTVPMLLLLESTWVIVARTAIPITVATRMSAILLIVTETTVVEAVVVNVTGTVTPMVVTIGIGVIVAALPLGVTPLTTTDAAGAIQGAPLVAAARLVLVSTMHPRMLPRGRVNRLVGKGS